MFPQATRILLVDDMMAVRYLITKLLGELGYSNIMEAGDGEEAFKVLDECHTGGRPVGLIICDLNMPKMDGLALLAKLRGDERFKRVPFMMLTAESDKDVILQAAIYDVSDYLIKPTTAHILSKRLAHVWAYQSKRKPA